MYSKLLFTKYGNGLATALYQDDHAVELSLYQKESASLLGNIYIGKVVNVVKNIQAAFIEIENGVPCYFPMDKHPVRIGDELLVQINREAVKTKAPSVTDQISLSGKYLVLTLGKHGIGCSSKLTEEEKQSLKQIMQEYLQEDCGWVIRTNAARISPDILKKEAENLIERMDQLKQAASHRTCRSCLYRAPEAYLQELKNTYFEEDTIILTDEADVYDRLKEYLETEQPEDAFRLKMYEDRLLPMQKLYRMETAFEEAFGERVWLKSGGYLVIQPTEALTVIDVNTGKFDGRKKKRETFLKINLEAARETARQLRLRNISGIIIVDFINMEEEADIRQILSVIREELKKDPKKAVVVDMTPLGLVEITRKRDKKPLYEQKNEIL